MLIVLCMDLMGWEKHSKTMQNTNYLFYGGFKGGEVISRR